MELEDRLYSSSEVAQILGVSLRSVYRYLEEDKLKAEVKTVTGRHRFTKNNILDFLYPNGSHKEDSGTRAQSSVINPIVTPIPKISKTRGVSTAFRKTKQVQDQGVIGEPDVAAQGLDAGVSTQPVDPSLSEPFQTQEPLQNEPVADGVTPPTVSVDEVKSEPVVPTDTTKSPSASKTDEDQKNEGAEVDWLARFRAARERLAKMQESEKKSPEVKSETPTPQPKVEAKIEEPVKKVSPEPEQEPKLKDSAAQSPVATVSESISSFVDALTEPEAPKEDVKPSEFYYTSGLGGLKEIAHSLNKAASNSSVPYGFSFYAGMSLYRSIKPFSVIHAYVRPEHVEFFERVLRLSPSPKSTAQLCLISSDDNSLFDSVKEMHGLKVVSLIRLKQDLTDLGEVEYSSELDKLS